MKIKKYFKLENYKCKLRQIFGRKYFRSYSQNGEDIIIQNIFSALKISRPSYLDIGAFHPRNGSNTYLLYKMGSRGITVEPNQLVTKTFKRYRPRDTHLSVGIAEKTGSMDYYIMSTGTLNTFNKTEAERYATLGYPIKMVQKIDVETVPEIIHKYCKDIFPDFLSVDTEGTDLDILKTINWQKSSPKVICVETIEFSPKLDGKKHDDIIEYLKNVGYQVYADTYINTIFVSKKMIGK
jgi:hypothetical protein